MKNEQKQIGQITLSLEEYSRLTHKDGIEPWIKTISLVTGIVGILIILWKISTYFNQIKNDTSLLAKNLEKFSKRVEGIHCFLIRKFEDYRHRDDD